MEKEKTISSINRSFIPGDMTLLDISAYVTLAAATFGGILEISSILLRWTILGILIVLCIWRARYHRQIDTDPLNNQIFMAGETLLVLVMLGLTSGSAYIAIMFFVLSVDAMLLFKLRHAFIWIGIFSIISMVLFIKNMGLQHGFSEAFLFISGYIFFGIFTNALYRAKTAQRNSDLLLDKLRASNKQLQDYTARIEEMTITQERNRLAREIHDTVGHRLTIAAVQIEGAQRLIESNPHKASSMLGTTRQQISMALQEIRQSVAFLRQPMEVDLPLTLALKQLVSAFRNATGLIINTSIDDSVPVLPYTAHMAVYRTAQEGLTNIQRHAQASNASLDLHLEENLLCLTITDDGIGINNSTSGHAGFGLMGMRERANQVHGEVKLENLASGGTRLVFTLPLSGETNYGGKN